MKRLVGEKTPSTGVGERSKRPTASAVKNPVGEKKVGETSAPPTKNVTASNENELPLIVSTFVSSSYTLYQSICKRFFDDTVRQRDDLLLGSKIFGQSVRF